MHGRTLLALALFIGCLLAPAAQAAPMPAGTYDVTLTNGTLKIGSGLLPAIPVQSGTSFALTLASQPLSAPIGLTVLSSPVNQSGTGYSFTGTVDVTILGAGATLDPTTGDATVDASFYGTLTGSGTVTVSNVSFPVSGNCTFGSQAQPVSLHLTTANGSAWDPATQAMSLADRTFALSYSCGSALFDTLISVITGGTGSGSNSATLDGTAVRRPDPTPATTTTPAGPSENPAPTGGTNTETTAPTATAAPLVGCVVPKLVGKTLKQAKRALKKAHCKAGKAKKKTSKKKKKGRILKQRYKVGTKLPAGTKVPLTVSKGPKKARSHSSR